MGASSQAASARLEKKFSMKPDADRDEILRRVRTAVANPALAADRSRPPLTLQPGARGRVLVARWQSEFAALGGHAYGPFAPAAAVAQTLALLTARGDQRDCVILIDPEAS